MRYPAFLLLASAALLPAQPPRFNISTIAGGAPPPTPSAALNTAFGQPQRVTTDAAGNVYFSSYNTVFKIDGSGNLMRLAGNARAGYSGDGGPATQAQLNQPQGLALDKAGDLYIADAGNHVVRIVTTDGNINTFAGSGSPGYTGDLGAAMYAQLDRPVALAVDTSGNLYIADSNSFVVRKVTTDGNIVTVAGNGVPGFAGDGGSGAGSQLSAPLDVATDSSGNVYIADSDNNSVRKLDSGGNIHTVAGNQTAGFSGDGAAATSAQLNAPVGVTVDSGGNLYIADYVNNRIRKVDTKGVITTYGGNGGFGFSGDGSAATSANLFNPLGIRMDASGNLYLVDLWNYRIRKIASSGTISTVAGNGTISYSGDGGPATSAQLNGPYGVTVDAARNVYISDYYNNRVRKVAPNGTITTVAGNGQGGFSGDGGAATAAQLYRPYGLAVDGAGNLYIADSFNSRIRKVSIDGTITTVAGNGNFGYSGDNAAATSAQLNLPAGVAVDRAGNIYIADTGNHRIREVSGGTITTIAGTGAQGYDNDAGPATSERLFYPNGVAVDSQGDVYIADTQNNRVRVITPDGILRLLAGNGYPGYYGDGGTAIESTPGVPSTGAAIVAPGSVAVDSNFNVYIASLNGGAVRVVDQQGIIHTVAGGGTLGYLGDGGSATSAQLNGVQALAIDAAGDVYVADGNNNAVRLLTPAGQ